MIYSNQNKFFLPFVITLCSVQALAGSSSVIYPKINNNGNTWAAPSPALTSDYDHYFVDMDNRYKAQIIRDANFSQSLKQVCAEVSALFYRYLHNQPEKALFLDSPSNSQGIPRKEDVPFIGHNSQYINQDMLIHYPMPSLNGQYHGQFVYQYRINQGQKSLFQLNKNSAGGNGKSKEIILLSELNYAYIDDNGNQQAINAPSLLVLLKIDTLKNIKKSSSEKHAFQHGQQTCRWLNK